MFSFLSIASVAFLMSVHYRMRLMNVLKYTFNAEKVLCRIFGLRTEENKQFNYWGFRHWHGIRQLENITPVTNIPALRTFWLILDIYCLNDAHIYLKLKTKHANKGTSCTEYMYNCVSNMALKLGQERHCSSLQSYHGCKSYQCRIRILL